MGHVFDTHQQGTGWYGAGGGAGWEGNARGGLFAAHPLLASLEQQLFASYPARGTRGVVCAYVKSCIVCDRWVAVRSYDKRPYYSGGACVAMFCQMNGRVDIPTETA